MNPIRIIVAATDLSPTGRIVLETARTLGAQLGAKVDAAHIVHDLSKYMGFYVGIGSLKDLQESLEFEARRKLQETCDSIFGKDADITVSVLKGTPYGDLVAHAMELGADLLIVGAHGLSKPEHKIFGSVAERLVKMAPCPVLVVGQG